MRGKKFILGIAAAVVLIMLCACGKKVAFDGSRTGDADHFDVVFDTLNTTCTHDMEMASGESIDVSVECISGTISIEIQKGSEAPVYRGNDMQTSSFQVSVEAAGTYTMHVVGEKAKGHVTFTRHASTSGETAPSPTDVPEVTSEPAQTKIQTIPDLFSHAMSSDGSISMEDLLHVSRLSLYESKDFYTADGALKIDPPSYFYMADGTLIPHHSNSRTPKQVFVKYASTWPALKLEACTKRSVPVLDSGKDCLIVRSTAKDGYSVWITENELLLCKNGEGELYEDNLLARAEFKADFRPDMKLIRQMLFSKDDYATYLAEIGSKRDVEVSGTGVYETGIPYAVDLDGDGKKEQLFVVYEGFIPDALPYDSWIWSGDDKWDTDFYWHGGELIYINGCLRYRNDHADQPFSGYFGIVDINASDRRLEVAVFDKGPSNDPLSAFYALRDGNIVSLLEIDDCIFDSVYVSDDHVPALDEDMLPGDGTVHWSGRLSILQTWWAPMSIRLNEDDSVTDLDELYYPNLPKPDPETGVGYVKLLYPLLAASERSADSERTRIEPADRAILDITDNVRWVHVTTDNGSGWIDIDNIADYVEDAYREQFSNYLPFEVGYNLFEGLSYAD